MASIGRLGRVARLSQRVSSLRLPQLLSGKRGLAATACLRYQQSLAKAQSSEIPADKYQRTTITEDVQQVSAQEGWEDPRSSAKVRLGGSSDGSLIDPTIRHFTVNFVPIQFYESLY
jgi:hypothetical protein